MTLSSAPVSRRKGKEIPSTVIKIQGALVLCSGTGRKSGKLISELSALIKEKEVGINETPAEQSEPVPAWDPEQCLSELAVDMLVAQPSAVQQTLEGEAVRQVHQCMVYLT